jgi:hypothetical protein
VGLLAFGQGRARKKARLKHLTFKAKIFCSS